MWISKATTSLNAAAEFAVSVIGAAWDAISPLTLTLSPLRGEGTAVVGGACGARAEESVTPVCFSLSSSTEERAGVRSRN